MSQKAPNKPAKEQSYPVQTIEDLIEHLDKVREGAKDQQHFGFVRQLSVVITDLEGTAAKCQYYGI